MRERWIDNGRGLLSIKTDTMYIHIQSRAQKNYHTISSNWSLFFMLKVDMDMRLEYTRILQVPWKQLWIEQKLY